MFRVKKFRGNLGCTQKSRIARTGKELGDGDFKKLQLKSFNLYKLVEFMKIENEINNNFSHKIQKS